MNTEDSMQPMEAHVTAVRVIHQVIVGHGGDGFRATCTCGWRSIASWDRAAVETTTRDDHKRRARLQEVP